MPASLIVSLQNGGQYYTLQVGDLQMAVHWLVPFLYFQVETDQKKMDKFKNCPLIKNLQFLSYHHET